MSYEYTSTVVSKLFNFAPALSNLNFSEHLSNPQTCQCKESKFCYEPHGHVITGDLRVIENAKLRNLLLKDQNIENQIGSTRKQQKQCFWNPLISMPKIGLKENKVELKYLSEWKDQLKELVADRI